MKQKTFAIIGGTLWGNRGAESMVVTTMGRVRETVPDASFLILSYYPAADRRLAGGAATPVAVDDATPRTLLLMHFPFALLCWLFRKIGIRLPDGLLPGPVRRLRACSALFDVSGISFHDGRLAIVAYNVFCIWPALLLGVPVLHLSQAMGPFRNRVNRAFGALVPRRLPPQLRARTPYRRARGHARPAGGALEHGGRRRLQLPARRQHHPRERRQGGRAPCRTHAHQG